VEYWGFV